MKKIALILIAGMGMASAAIAQSPADQLKGKWIFENKAGFCGRSIYDITSVDADGTVRGTFACEKINFYPRLGSAANNNSVKATLTGNHFVMENAFGGGNDLTLNGNKLEGTGKANRDSLPSPTTFVKQ
jgi:hypothetical protein